MSKTSDSSTSAMLVIVQSPHVVALTQSVVSDDRIRRWSDAARLVRHHQRTFGPISGVAHMILGRLVPGHRVEVRVGADERLLRLRLGTTDVSVFDEVVVRGEYDFAAPGTVATVVDAGANIGITAAWYAARYPGCRVVAIEPEP